jgi:hypothetical protein
MNTSDTITNPLQRQAFGRQLARRTLSVLRETGLFFLAPVVEDSSNVTTFNFREEFSLLIAGTSIIVAEPLSIP